MGSTQSPRTIQFAPGAQHALMMPNMASMRDALTATPDDEIDDVGDGVTQERDSGKKKKTRHFNVFSPVCRLPTFGAARDKGLTHGSARSGSFRRGSCAHAPRRAPHKNPLALSVPGPPHPSERF